VFLDEAGGKVLTNDNKKAAFNTPEGRSALNFMHKLVVEDKAATVVTGYLSDGFNTGKYAMDLDTVAAMTFLTNPKTSWKVAPLPKGVKYAVPTAGTNIVLFKQASPEEKKAAAKYIDWLTSRENTIAWAEKTGYLPVRQSALTDPGYLKYVQRHPSLGVAPKELKYGYFSPRLAQMFSGQNQATTYIGNCMSGKESVDEALKHMEQAINEALQGD
jgi:ABC-type glycerol-3-phosphate transport system substrate-binding protein